MANMPVEIIRFGMIKVSVWRNATRSGERHAVSVVRLYRNGDQWKESSRFSRDDLLLVAKAMDQAHTWICANSQRES